MPIAQHILAQSDEIIVKEFPSKVQFTTGMLSYDLPIVIEITRTNNQYSSYKQ